MSDNLRRSSRRSKKRDYSVGDIVELEVSKYFVRSAAGCGDRSRGSDLLGSLSLQDILHA